MQPYQVPRIERGSRERLSWFPAAVRGIRALKIEHWPDFTQFGERERTERIVAACSDKSNESRVGFLRGVRNAGLFAPLLAFEPPQIGVCGRMSPHVRPV
uniref:Uncharacterized protein n=1 Tax=mine drainage metagenome TaxID=410659 RepID=E6Q4X3_9ZZZZ